VNNAKIAEAFALVSSALKLLEEGIKAADPPTKVAAVEGEILNCKGAAELVHLHPKIVERRAREGEMPAFRLPGMRGWRFKRSELLAWLEEGRKAA